MKRVALLWFITCLSSLPAHAADADITSEILKRQNSNLHSQKQLDRANIYRKAYRRKMDSLLERQVLDTFKELQNNKVAFQDVTLLVKNTNQTIGRNVGTYSVRRRLVGNNVVVLTEDIFGSEAGISLSPVGSNFYILLSLDYSNFNVTPDGDLVETCTLKLNYVTSSTYKSAELGSCADFLAEASSAETRAAIKKAILSVL